MTEYAPKNNKEEAKPQMSLLPLDILAKYVCPAYEEGVLKYERESWRKGFKVSILIDAALRHITSFFYDSEDYDSDASLVGVKKHHLGGAVFCLLSILQTLECHPELDDRLMPKKCVYDSKKFTIEDFNNGLVPSSIIRTTDNSWLKTPIYYNLENAKPKDKE